MLQTTTPIRVTTRTPTPWFYLVALALAFTWGQCAGRLELHDYGERRFQEGRQLELLRAQPLVQAVARLDSLIADSSCVAQFRPREDSVTWFERARAVAPRGGHLP
jgi:hypothetical protein